VQRLSDFRLAATFAVGASVALAVAPAAGQNAAVPAAGQNAGTPGLIGSPAPGLLDPGAMTPRSDLGTGTTAFDIPAFGNPPGFGAGTTGFDSTGGARRKPRPKPQPKPGARSPGTVHDANAPNAPSVPAGAAGLRPVPQLIRHGAPVVDPSPSLAPLPPVVTPPRHPATDPTPFAQLGLREGVFLIMPAVEFTAGYDSNPLRGTPVKGSSEFIVAPELLVRSDWERHALNADIHGSYTAFGSDFPASPVSLDRPNLDARASGRIDASHTDIFTLESRLLVSTDNPGSPNIQAGLTRLPIVTTIGGTFGYEHDFNRFQILAKTTVDRSVWQDSSLTDGTTSSNDDRNFNQYAGILRGSYELLPGIKPFVEGSVDTRIHDVAIDRTGADRDSEGVTVRAGTTFEFTGKLTGEASLGQTQRDYKDPSLPNISGLVFDSSLLFAATSLTTMKLTAVSTTGELIIQGASGVLRRDFGFEVDHDFRRWLTGAVKFGYGADTYFGLDRFDNRYSAGATLTYKLSRTVYLKGEYRHEWLRSTDSPANYDADVVLLSVRVQR
jgi:hypothetical protein